VAVSIFPSCQAVQPGDSDEAITWGCIFKSREIAWLQ